MMEILFPDSQDEIKAQEENESLNRNEFVEVLPTDNHEQHLLVHRMAKNTWAKWTHIAWHEELLNYTKQQAVINQEGQMMGLPAEPVKPQVGVAGQNPREAAASLRGETIKSIQQNPITK